MVIRTRSSIRPATIGDQRTLAHLIHFDSYTHRHLDYRPPLDWIGEPLFKILEEDGRIIGALACPPDPPQVAWIRLFAATYDSALEEVWEALWEDAHQQLEHKKQNTSIVSAIPLHAWFENLLYNSGFEPTHEIVVLRWARQELTETNVDRSLIVRPMSLDDLPAVYRIDQSSFVPTWQNSLLSLEFAFRQAVVATVVELKGRIKAYQISTPTQLGGHIARLAVEPDMQGQGIGYALLRDTLIQFSRRGASLITVNTQKENRASLSLYKKAGFEDSNEEYPIFQLALE